MSDLRQKRARPKSDVAAPARNEKALQRAAVKNEATGEVLDSVHETLNSPAQPLDQATRTFMESRFGHDFSGVQVHNDAKAVESANTLEAKAYTLGQHLVFNQGQYQPETGTGQGLLAHELAHVVQQNGTVSAKTERINQAGDPAEAVADQAASDVLTGQKLDAPLGTTADVGVQRQPLHSPGLSQPILSQSQGEIVVKSFLDRMWAAQSKQDQPFRITAGVLDGLQLVFQLGVPNLGFTIFPSTEDVMKRLSGKVPQTLAPLIISNLDNIAAKEKALPAGATTQGDPAEPKFPTPGPAPLQGINPDSRKPPEKGKDETDAMQEVLKQAFEEFRKTKVGKELEQAVKSYVFSKEGIPLVIIVTSGVLAFVAANDPKLPSVPEIELGEGVKLKFEYSGKVSDLPPYLRQLVKGQSDPNPPSGKEEVKAGLTLTLTNEAIVEIAQAVGRFFVKAAGWIAKGIVTVGTVIGKAAASAKRELLAMAGGAALGAVIGGIFGGGLGAGVGALIGAGVGLIGSLISRLF